MKCLYVDCCTCTKSIERSNTPLCFIESQAVITMDMGLLEVKFNPRDISVPCYNYIWTRSPRFHVCTGVCCIYKGCCSPSKYYTHSTCDCTQELTVNVCLFHFCSCTGSIVESNTPSWYIESHAVITMDMSLLNVKSNPCIINVHVTTTLDTRSQRFDVCTRECCIQKGCCCHVKYNTHSSCDCTQDCTVNVCMWNIVLALFLL